MKKFLLIFFILFFFIFFLQNVYSDTEFNFNNTIKGEYYGVSGNEQAGAYRHKGVEPYDEFNFGIINRKNPYNLLRFSLFGVTGDSEYRTPDDKFVVERWNLFKEQGDVALPYRIELGDYYGFFSYRTIQTSLKGLKLELQPQWSRDKGIYHSIVMFGGVKRQRWNDFKLKEYLSSGISYLIETKNSRYSINSVYNKKYTIKNIPEFNQVVTSMAFERRFNLSKQKLLFEGEFSYFNGDHLGGNSGVVKNKNGEGVYFQLQNLSSKGYSYRLRYENYSEHYSPDGASITPDRHVYELHLGYKFKNGFDSRFRLQRFENNVHSSKTIVNTGGLNLFGSFKSFSLNINGFIQHNDPKRGSSTTNRVLNTNFLYSLAKNVNARLGLSYTNSTDDTSTKGVNLGMDFSGKMGNKINSTFSPFVSYRKTEYTSSEEREYGGGFMVALNGGRHNFNSNIAFNFQDMDRSPNILNVNYGLTYQYRLKRNVFSLEFTGSYRDPKDAEMTNSYKVAALWTFYFTKRFKPQKKKIVQKVEAVESKKFSPEIFSIIYPGILIEPAINILSSYNIGEYITQGNFLIYEVKMFETVDLRQRFVIVKENKKIKKLAVIFESISDYNELLSKLAKINEELMKIYGSPVSFYEKGKVTKNLVNDLRQGNFSRIYEWYFSNGILRVGIPARVDNEVRIEIQYAKSFPPYNYAFWSIESIK